MSDYPSEPEPPAYTPPPATVQPPVQQPYGYPYPPPPGYPGYPPGYALQHPGYPSPYPPGYGYQYLPYPPRGSGRPGMVLAAAVLGYVVAGFLIIAGIGLLAGATLVHDLGSNGGFDTRDATAELTFDGIVNFVAGGLLISGGVLLAGRRVTGRVLFLTAVAIDIGAAIYWLSRAGSGDGGIVFYALLFNVPAIIAACFVLTPSVRRWLAAATTTPSAR
jgi:hypothetical protein